MSTCVHVPYPDGSNWLVTHCEVIIPAEEARHLTAVEIGERVLALLPRTDFLAYHMPVWMCNPELKTLRDVEEYVASPPRGRTQPQLQPKVGQPTTSTPKGFVYVIRGDKYYKIGRTADPYKRLTPMTAHAPFPLETLLLIPTEDMVHTEKTLHIRFADKHRRGEWYDLAENDLALIREDYATIDPVTLRAN